MTIILILYVAIPVMALQSPPFHVFHLDPERVKGIEVVHWGESVKFEEPEELSELVDKLNHTHYFFWVLIPPKGGSDYILHIYYGTRDISYTLGSDGLSDGNVVYLCGGMPELSYDLFP